MTASLLLTVALALAPSAWSRAADEQAVRAADAARIQAFVTNDFDALERLLADDLTYTHSNAQLDSKAQLIESLRSGRTRYQRIEPHEVQVRVYGETAVLTGRADVAVLSGGQPMAVSLRFTSVYVRKNGAWRFAAWQSTRIPQ